MNLCECPSNPCCIPYDFYSFAQYGVQTNVPSGSDVPMFTLFQEGNKIILNNDIITLSAGYLYLVNYIFTATTEANGYMQITPEINGTPNLLYSYFAPAGAQSRNTSASGSFTTNAALLNEATLAFHLTYPDTVRNIDLSGAVSVTAMPKVKGNTCD